MLGVLRLAVISFFFTLMEFAKGSLVWKWWEPRNRAAQLAPQLPNVQVQLESSAVSQLEEQPSLPTVRQPNSQSPNFIDHVMKMQWALLIIGVCFAAVGAALQALQTPAPTPTFHGFYMLLELAFLASLVSAYIRRRYETASIVMAHFAILSGATAFMLAIGVNLPARLMGISIALYVVAVLIIIFANR